MAELNLGSLSVAGDSHATKISITVPDFRVERVVDKYLRLRTVTSPAENCTLIEVRCGSPSGRDAFLRTVALCQYVEQLDLLSLPAGPRQLLLIAPTGRVEAENFVNRVRELADELPRADRSHPTEWCFSEVGVFDRRQQFERLPKLARQWFWDNQT
jgi:hypothetical protein